MLGERFPAVHERYLSILDHGDEDIHDTKIKINASGILEFTSLFDWDTGIIVPTMLSDLFLASGT